MGVFATLCTLLCGLTVGLRGLPGVICAMMIFFFESCQYTTIFTLALQDLGANTKTAGAFVVMGVGGGAIFAPIQGIIADRRNTRLGQIIPTLGFAYLIFYVVFLAKSPAPIFESEVAKIVAPVINNEANNQNGGTVEKAMQLGTL